MKYIQMLIACLLIVSSVHAQDRNNEERSKKKRARTEAKLENQKIGYITNELDLSTEEAQKFWPIYNEYHKKVKELKVQSGLEHKKIDWDQLTDDEAGQLLAEVLEQEQAELDLKVDYFKRIESALPRTKIAKLYIAEKRFKKEVLDYVRKKMKDKRGEKRREKRGM